MAHFHVQLVSGLCILSGVGLQAHAEIFQIFQKSFWRSGRKTAAGVCGFFYGLVCNGNLARSQLELYRMGTCEFCRPDGIGRV